MSIQYHNINELALQVAATMKQNNASTTGIAELEGSINITWLGAKGDGITDNTNVIQKAINTYTSIYIPPGTYLCSTLLLASNTRLYGCGKTSIIKQLPNITTSLLYGLSSNSSIPLDNIVIEQLTLYGRVEDFGFVEHTHLIDLRGITNTIIKDCWIKGFQGDGIYLGGHTDNLRHNSNVIILNNLIDGINKNNRNGISIVDGDNILISNNNFVNITRIDMPGMIDLEPNHINNILQNITIVNNHFVSSDAGVGIIGIFIQFNLTTPPNNFIISNNTCDIPTKVFFVWNNTINFTGAVPQNIVLEGNSVRCLAGFHFLSKVNGASVIGNTFKQNVSGSILGFTATDIIKNVAITGNSFYGDNSYRGITVRNCTFVNISNNTFTNFKDQGILFGITGCNINNIIIIGNVFNNITVLARSVDKDIAATIDAPSSFYVNNVWSGTFVFP